MCSHHIRFLKTSINSSINNIITIEYVRFTFVPASSLSSSNHCLLRRRVRLFGNTLGEMSIFCPCCPGGIPPVDEDVATLCWASVRESGDANIVNYLALTFIMSRTDGRLMNTLFCSTTFTYNNHKVRVATIILSSKPSVAGNGRIFIRMIKRQVIPYHKACAKMATWP